MNKIPAIMSWSGGKDSAYALHTVLQAGVYDVQFLLSNFNGEQKRLSTHGISEALIEAQSEALGIPLQKMYVYESSNAAYEKALTEFLETATSKKIFHVIFGDIFLEDLRAYREEKLAAVGMQAVFPLWGKNTLRLVRSFIDDGFKSMICCVNDAYLTEKHAGKIIDHPFIDQLPLSSDPCGENGEYHSFCFDGPVYTKPIAVAHTNTRYKSLPLTMHSVESTANAPITLGFWYANLILAHTLPKHEPKSCERCGQYFECKPGDITHCQCFGRAISAEVKDWMAKKYIDCICGNCITALNNPSILFREKFGSSPH